MLAGGKGCAKVAGEVRAPIAGKADAEAQSYAITALSSVRGRG